MDDVKIVDWYGCYGQTWGKLITDDAVAHPAKYSRRLIRRIYEYAIEQGYLKRGDVVLDPFGGIGLGGCHAARNGLHFIGVELEGRFVDFGAGYDCPGFGKADWKRFYYRAGRVNFTHDYHWCPDCVKDMKVGDERVIPSASPHRYRGNFDIWREQAAHFPRWGTFRLIRGDSRRLAQVLEEAGALVSSPPYEGSVVGSSDYIERMERLCAMPFHELAPRWQREVTKYLRVRGATSHCQLTDGGYGAEDGQLGAMPAGDHDAIISSPPYRGGGHHSGVFDTYGGEIGDSDSPAWKLLAKKEGGYGKTPGQMEEMDTGDHAIVVSSPPYAGNDKRDNTCAERDTGEQGQGCFRNTYGREVGQLGAMPTGVVSSPPYADGCQRTGGDDPNPQHVRGGKLHTPGIAGAISSPPYQESVASDDPDRRGGLFRDPKRRGDKSLTAEYGGSDGQLAGMPQGEPPGGVISSPPFLEGRESARNQSSVIDDVDVGSGYVHRKDTYGKTEGQLEAMPEGDAGGIISSPPYATETLHGRGGIDHDKLTGNPPGPNSQALIDNEYGRSDGQLGAMKAGNPSAVLSSPPYGSDVAHGRSGPTDARLFERPGARGQTFRSVEYGDGPDQLGAMPTGDHAAVVSSPPYAGIRQDGGRIAREGEGGFGAYTDEPPECWHTQRDQDNVGNLRDPSGDFDAVVGSPPFESSLGKTGESKGFHSHDEHEAYNRCKRDYVEPTTDGQLGQMRGGFGGAVSSPPYRDGGVHQKDQDVDTAELNDWRTDKSGGRMGVSQAAGYGETDGQLGQESQETFWSAARTIMEQCYQVLAPGAVAIWVVKSFIRNKERVDFPGQWRMLGEACGFETVEVIRAWLSEDRGAQYDLFGNLVKSKVERKSFFRRLYEKKARAEKHWESVIRTDQARFLLASRAQLWETYEHDVEVEDARDGHKTWRDVFGNEDPKKPTKTQILSNARAMAYEEAGEPHIEIDTSIDYEVVLIQRKPLRQGVEQ